MDESKNQNWRPWRRLLGWNVDDDPIIDLCLMDMKKPATAEGDTPVIVEGKRE